MVDLSNWFQNQMNMSRRESDRKAAVANVELQTAEELAARNEQAAMRQNRAAMGTGGGGMSGRLGGQRYSRRQTWRPGGTGGLAAANANALKQARMNAATAQVDARHPRMPSIQYFY